MAITKNVTINGRNYIEIEMMESGLPKQENQVVIENAGCPIPPRKQEKKMVEVVTWNEKWEPVIVFVEKMEFNF